MRKATKENKFLQIGARESEREREGMKCGREAKKSFLLFQTKSSLFEQPGINYSHPSAPSRKFISYLLFFIFFKEIF